MTLTVRSATVSGATTKGSALTHAELDENFNHLSQSSNHSFTQSGSGALTEAVSAALQRLPHTAQYSTEANWITAKNALTGTFGMNKLHIGGTAATTGNRLTVMLDSSNTEGIVVDSPAGQTTDLMTWRVNGTVVVDITSTGGVECAGISFVEGIGGGGGTIAEPAAGAFVLTAGSSGNGNFVFNALAAGQHHFQYNGTTKWFSHATGVEFDNAYTLYWQNSTGTAKEILRGQADNITGIVSLGNGIKLWSSGFGTAYWEMIEAGTWRPVTDAAADIGTASTNRVKDIHMTGNLNAGGAIKSSGATSGIGYATGAGGTVTQGAGSGKATTVELNKATGQITMDGAILNADTTVSFTLTNSAIALADHVLVQHVSGGTVGSYFATAVAAAGSATVYVRNITAGNLTEAPVIKFTVIKAVTS